MGRNGRQSWLNWALEQCTAILIAAAPPLEETALVLSAWSCVHWLQRGSLPTDTGIRGVVVLPVGPAPPASVQGGFGGRLHLWEEAVVWSWKSFLADPREACV